MSLIGLLGFGTVVLVAMLLLHGYLWWRLVRSTTYPGRLRRRLTLLTVVLGLLPPLAVGLRRTLPLDAATPLDWIAYSWLGIAFYLFLTLLVLEPVRLIARLFIRRSAWRETAEQGDEEFEPSGARRVPRRCDGRAQPDATGSWPRCRPEVDRVMARARHPGRGRWG